MSKMTNRNLIRIIVALLCVLVLACVALFVVRVAYPLYAYAQEQRAAFDLVRQLAHRKPPEANAKAWEVATRWASTAVGNVCFSEEHVPIAELRRFRADLAARLEGDVDLSTIDWIWQRLAKTGPHGREYQQKFEAAYRDEVNAALQKTQ
jgi:hypothetical protein